MFEGKCLALPDFLTLFQNGMIADAHNRYIAKELYALNDYTEGFGIALSQKDCLEIAVSRNKLLVENERIEVGAGAVTRIIEGFCDSGYVDPRTFKDTVQDLLECFYALKTETDDTASDDDVLEFLSYAFEATGGDVAKIYMLEAFDAFISSAKSTAAKQKKKSNRL